MVSLEDNEMLHALSKTFEEQGLDVVLSVYSYRVVGERITELEVEVRATVKSTDG